MHVGLSIRCGEALLDLGFVREGMAKHYSGVGSPLIDPELMIRMLLIGYLQGIRSERRLVEEVHLNLTYRWFCRLGLDGRVPERSTFSKNRYGRFAEGDVFREVVRRRRAPMCCGRHRAGRERGRGWQLHRERVGAALPPPPHPRALPTMTDAGAFRGFRFPAEVIPRAVRWYLPFPVSDRDLERMLADRGVEVDHVSLFRWVQRFAPEPGKRVRRHLRPCRGPWHVDGTYVRVDGNRHAFMLGQVGDRASLPALDPPPPAVGPHQRLDQRLVAARLPRGHSPFRRHDQLRATPALQPHRDADGQNVDLDTRARPSLGSLQQGFGAAGAEPSLVRQFRDEAPDSGGMQRQGDAVGSDIDPLDQQPQDPRLLSGVELDERDAGPAQLAVDMDPIRSAFLRKPCLLLVPA